MSLAIREMQFKASMAYHFRATQIPKIKHILHIKCYKQLELLYIVGGNLKCFNHFWKHFLSF
jgi:hypothetical protein